MEKTKMKTKICCKCQQSLPLDCFSKSKTAKDGKQSYCKRCKALWVQEYYAEHPDKLIVKIQKSNEARKNYRLINKELVRELDALRRGTTLIN